MPPPRIAPMAAPRMAPQMPLQLARPSGGPSPSAIAGSAPTQRTIAAQGQTVRNLAGPGGRDGPNLNVASPHAAGRPVGSQRP